MAAQENPPRRKTPRDTDVANTLGYMQDQSVLLIGIGGGGDVVSTLPTCFDLERIGARVTVAGLTWKRQVHDSYARPRPISHFDEVTVVNELIGEASPDTCTKEGIVHVEAKVSRALNGRPVGMIDISPGSGAVREALIDYCEKRKIAFVVGIDAGGDVLCVGNEQTLESPLCDQLMLSVISKLDRSLLGVFGFGSDGEMSLEAFRARFAELHAKGAYVGTLPILESDIERMVDVLKDAPTEASRLPIEIAKIVDKERLDEIRNLMNAGTPDLDGAIRQQHALTMDDGFRIADLSELSATTMFFNPVRVFYNSKFSQLWDEKKNIEQMRNVLVSAGMVTELSQTLSSFSELIDHLQRAVRPES